MDYDAAVGRRIVGAESALRTLPMGLPPQEFFNLGALVTAAQMVDHAYAHLEALAIRMMQRILSQETPADGPAALHEAWSLVDLGNKMRSLVRRVMDTNPSAAASAALGTFIDRTTDVWDVRDTYQHLDRLAPRMIQAGEQATGSLSWLGAEETDSGEFFGFLVMPGPLWTDPRGAGIVPIEEGRSIRLPVDHFFLESWRPTRGGAAPRGPEGRVRVGLTALVAEVDRLMGVCERSLAATLEALPPDAPRASSDMYGYLRFQPAKEAPSPEGP